VALFLLCKALLQGLHQFLKSSQGLDLGLLFIGEEPLRHSAQPLFGNVRPELFVDIDHSLEIAGKDPIELVKMTLVLDQTEPGQVIEVLDTAPCDLLVQRFEQAQILPDGCGHLGLSQLHEKVDQHSSAPATVAGHADKPVE
jgi:hypothetical protein